MIVFIFIAAAIVAALAFYLAAKRWTSLHVFLRVVVAIVLSSMFLLTMVVLAGFPILAWTINSREQKFIWEWLMNNGWAVAVVWLSVVALGMTLVVQQRRARRQTTLDVLALAVEKRMPLPPVIRALAADQYGNGRLLGLAENLERGMSLSAALEADKGLLPRDALVAAKMGEATGNLTAAFEQVEASDALRSPLRRAMLGHMFYLVSLAFFVPVAFGYVTYIVVPKIIEICFDFGVDLPPLTVLGVRFVYSYGWIGFCLPIVGAAVLIYLTLWYADFWPLPTFGWGRRLKRGQFLRAIALATEGRRPLGETLSALARTYPQPETARHLRACADETQAGANWNISLLKHGLIGVNDAALIEAAQRLNNLPWAMREAADGNDRRLIYRLETALNVFSPLVILAWGAVILFFAMACFLPLVKLIFALSE